ncbi:ATP-binding cassette domain-containing protein [Candidatus Nomurabacteria bacterium]|nr:ATP-binding cassette domain-containing protein [Candidatus Saccharibacteria bacterium]MCB9839712.1 ATP-binding cassette domain-containing protein [Candidatus Nomurabacteria bacterium]
MRTSKYAVEVRGLKKSYAKNAVLKGIDLKVEKGTMLALLGPNGAGKTTTVRILSTLLKYDEGEAKVGGFDVIKQADKVRSIIGLTGQSAAVDELLTGRENLVMMGRLYRLTKASASLRANELLEQFDLVEAANRPAKTYSGGMRRRLDLAVSLIATPPIIFLDEPTTGLDPRSRIAMWRIIEQLKQDGTTILLTTQYLEEADQLADQIAVVDGGKIIAKGTSRELKSKVGNDRLVVSLANKTNFDSAVKLFVKEIATSDAKNHQITVAVKDNNKDVRIFLEKLEKAKIKISSIDIHKPTLDDVFLSLTGKQTNQSEQEEK